jgi:serine/threonine-protein kinase
VFKEGSSFGPYSVVKQLGGGAMGEVFLAARTGPGGFFREVVIKRITPTLAAKEDFLRMFKEEAGIVARLTHSNIAQVYDFGEIDGVFYLAMEYVRGITLFKLTRELGADPMPPEHAVRIAADVARGLHHAHRATDSLGRPLGLIHRDVTPANVLLSFEGEVKLIDFGIARSTTRSIQTDAGVVKGTPGYMSPEQCRAKPLDPRSDVFSLGIVLWELLTGKRLFWHENAYETMHAIVTVVPEPPSRLRPGLPDDIDEIVLRALGKEPEARFETAAEMAQALDSFLATHRLLSNAELLKELIHRHMGGASPARGGGSGAPSDPTDPDQGSGPGAQGRGASTAVLPHRRNASGDDRRDGHVPGPSARAAGVGGGAARGGGRSMARRMLLLALAVGAFGFIVGAGLVAGPCESRTPAGSGTSNAPQDIGDVAALVSATPLVADGSAQVPDADTAGPRDAGSSGATGADEATTLDAPDPTGDGGSPVDAAEETGAPGDALAPPMPGPTPGGGPGRRTGRLTIDTRPWSVVSTGGRTLGETPVIETVLPAGPHVLVLTDGAGRRHVRRVRVLAEGVTRVRFDLQRDGP